MAKKRHRRQKMTRIGALKQKLRSDKLFAGKELVVQPSGKEKMSEVLEAFVEPYRDAAKTFQAYQALITVGIVAWNAALTPKNKRRGMLDDALEAAFPSDDPVNRQIFQGIVNELVERKERHFPENKRFILSYQLSENRDNYHLAVAPTLQ
jgi:hypothetical protein